MIASGFSGGLRYPVDSRSDCEWQLDDQSLSLGPMLGEWLDIRITGRVRCQHCERISGRSFGQGYCYECFRTLARCDLCMMDPTRCHFAAGTCREPEWARDVCFTPHTVYLAVSSGLKVGITRWGNETVRWRNQGAVTGIRLLRCDSRQLAGSLEAMLATQFNDRTNWRELVSAPTPAVDLPAARVQALQQLGPLPVGATACDEAPVQLVYPDADKAPPKRLQLLPEQPLIDQLRGVRGQYLLFASGALNLRRVQGFELTLALLAPSEVPTAPQLELF